EDGIRDLTVTGVQTCALPIYQDSRTTLLQAWSKMQAQLADAQGIVSSPNSDACYRDDESAYYRPLTRVITKKSATASSLPANFRSEERRVGNECRSRWERDN